MAITPDAVVSYNLGDVKLTRATFISQAATDGETWASGIKSYLGCKWQGVGDNDYDVQVSGVSNGTFTFVAGTSQTGYLYIFSYDY
jgi:hypothetical protein